MKKIGKKKLCVTYLLTDMISTFRAFATSVRELKSKHNPCISLPYARHYNPRLAYFYPIFEDHFFDFKEFYSENSVLMYGQYSRAVCNQEQVIMARVLTVYQNHIVH